MTLRPRQNDRHFPDDIFKWIFVNENARILIKFSLKFVPRGSINNIPAFVQIMARRQPGDKSLSEPMVVRLPTHICVARPQWDIFTPCIMIYRVSVSYFSLSSFLAYDVTKLGQYWFMWWLVVCWRQAIPWTNVELSPWRSSAIRLKTMSITSLAISISEIRFKITAISPWANGLC